MSEQAATLSEVVRTLQAEQLLGAEATDYLHGQSVQQPWSIRAMVGFGAWLASLLLIGFVASFSVMIDGGYLFIGLALVAGAVLVRRRSENDFLVQSALAASLAGLGLSAFGLAKMIGFEAVEPFLAQQNDGAENINFVSSAQVYGGTFQLFNVRMAERGAEVRWITEPWKTETWEPLIDEHTRFLYAEMPSNPQQVCTDLKAVADLAHHHGIPLVVDATFATPSLCRPMDHGADVVVQ